MSSFQAVGEKTPKPEEASAEAGWTFSFAFPASHLGLLLWAWGRPSTMIRGTQADLRAASAAS